MESKPLDFFLLLSPDCVLNMSQWSLHVRICVQIQKLVKRSILDLMCYLPPHLTLRSSGRPSPFFSLAFAEHLHVITHGVDMLKIDWDD